MSVAVPVIDLAPLKRSVSDHDAVATINAIDDACVRTGFFVVTGHGIEHDIADIFRAANDLFGLGDADKLTIAMRRRCGYVDDGAKEMFDVALELPAHDRAAADGNRWPDLEGFRSVVSGYQSRALAVAQTLLEALAIALGIEPTFFADRMRRPECFLRMLRYPPADVDHVSTRAHSDYGAITLLATDGVAGLQVYPIGGPWIDVDAPAGSIVVNLGDMLARWTNDRYVSTPHRVVSRSNAERYSVPFFVNPDPDTVVECIPACATPERPRRYQPVTATEFLQGRIDGTISVAMP